MYPCTCPRNTQSFKTLLWQYSPTMSECCSLRLISTTFAFSLPLCLSRILAKNARISLPEFQEDTVEEID
jgi:hypothetical protein